MQLKQFGMKVLAAGMLLLPALAFSAPACKGVGLPHDAPMFYLISARVTDKGIADEPSGKNSTPDKRERLADIFAKNDVDVFLFNRNPAGDRALGYGVTIGLFRSVDLNGDIVDDLFIYEPAGAFYFIMLYAGCGDDYYTPVGSFDSREIPVPARYSPVNGVKWAEFEVIAPDRTMRHADPLVNWAKRTWSFDGKVYRQMKVEPLK
ncbi:hypothetical protein NB640_11420 [Oxalobacter vibrioformis]|uniref:Lipoprotein n=1 Tax=Oxalobacter vibrioformis TaxID=933080 RepID=A0A9E9LVX6_9BURK|nr:hypothetical protein [Oxalobacter vibrioformis]WAW09814.1 hypothetical protein NB640_11420 [Oxalobacter vibrioformis]